MHIFANRRSVALAALLTAVACRDGSSGRPAAARAHVRIAAAADLRYVLDLMTTAFTARHPEIGVDVTYGSSGSFFAQLLNRAPFDLFLSADVAYPRQLSERGLTAPGSDFTYAVGRIVVWAPNGSPLDLARLGMNALVEPAAQHVAIANPDHAPYGRAAVAALRSAGLYERVAPKLVFGENVSQALQFVQSGAADAGVVAMSLAVSPPVSRTGRYWEIPLESSPRMEQGGVILRWASDPEAARLFRSFLLGEDGRALLKRYGFFLPGA